jgi:4-amino-4-deoxy-L-arabinose transferase-like glycosyltransferase/GT2 family glycosyltransferase
VSDHALTDGQLDDFDPLYPTIEGRQARGTMPPPAAPRRFGPAKLRQLPARRFGVFSGIGVVVLVLGTLLQGVLIWFGVGKTASYIWQGVFSVELSFYLNRWLTWGDRDVNLIMAFLKWNLQKLALTVPNVVVFAWLEHLGWNWLVANLVLTIFFTLANYLGGNIYSFRVKYRARHGTHGEQLRADPAATYGSSVTWSAEQAPEASVIIPVKNSQRTIRATVEALLAQDYPALIEVIVVGDVLDQTWQALTNVADPRLILIELPEIPGKRDPAIKRDVGLRRASGTVVALADSDIVMDPDWLSRGVTLLAAQGGGVVCGGMRSVEDSFWGRFVDRNVIAAKTPRVPHSYAVTAQNFGRRGKKPPITANVVMSRDVYDVTPMDCTWAYGYEDYEWFWRLARDGHKILYAAGLTGAHHHRRSFSALATEYRRSARGCERFIREHADSPLSRKRRMEAVMLPLGAVALLVVAGAASMAGYAAGVVTVALSAALTLVVREVIQTRRLEALAYPVVGLALGLTFVAELGWQMAKNRPTTLSPTMAAGASTMMFGGIPLLLHDQVVLPAEDGIAPPASQERPLVTAPLGPNTRLAEPDRALGRTRNGPVREPYSRRVRLAAAFCLVLVGGAALRFWQLASKPDWQFDEGTYWDIAKNLQVNGTLNEHITYGAHWAPFLFQPPLYLIVVARWFALVGPTIYHARILGVTCSLIGLLLLWRLIWRQSGPRAALFVSIPIVFDGWLLYIQRVSYIENAVLLLVIAGMLLYQRALDRPTGLRFALAGLVLGLAVCVKYDSAYAVIAAMLCWAILRRHHKGHLVLLGTTLVMIAAEQVTFSRLFDVAGHNWWVDQSLTQVGRVLGVGVDKGSLESPFQLLHLLFAQYKVFLPSLVVAFVAFGLIIARLVRCYGQRSMASLRPQAVLYSWAIAGVAVFGFSSLRYQQYFALALLPLYCVFWTELWRWKSGSMIKIAAVVAAVALGLGSFWLRVESKSNNVFEQVQAYATAHIPADAVVIADESIGDLISQPYCQEQNATPCLWHATYAITWTTYLQSTFKLGDPAFHLMMRSATRVWSSTGFNGTVTVWRLN